ncbi:MAG: SNF2-related protein [Kiritimatiellia bacterium]|jgi:hypothetical protein
MRILHAAWLPSELLLWGTTSEADEPLRVSSAAELRSALRSIPGMASAASAPVEAVTARLPVDGGRIVRDGRRPAKPSRGAPASFSRLRVEALRLPWGAWGDLSAAIPLPGEGAAPVSRRVATLLARGVQAGNDVLAWTALWRYAGSLVCRQCYLPGIEEGARGVFEARWRPILVGPEAPRLQRLASALPDCAFALGDAGESRESGAEAFLGAALDFLVRRAATTPLTRAHAARGIFASAHDAWLAALRADSPRIEWESAADLEDLRARLFRWSLPATVDAARLRIRLEDPAPGSPGDWRLAVSVAKEGEEAGAPFASLPLRDRVAALMAWGQAAKLCPLFEEAFDGDGDARASGRSGALSARIGATRAHAFLRSFAPLLASAGYSVLLPDWWRPADGTPRPRLELQGRVVSLEGAADDVDGGPAKARPADAAPLSATVRWEVALGDETLTIEDIDALAAEGAPLVACRGRWIEVDRSTLSAARRMLETPQDERISMADLLRLALGGGARRGLPVAAIRADGPAKRLLEHLQGGASAPAPASQPIDFQGELRPYQLRGLSWMLFLRQWGFGACLADDMGLGKTIQALALLLAVRAAGERRPALLVCPTTLIGNWLREAGRFAPSLDAIAHHGPDRLEGEFFRDEAARHGLVVTSYALLQRDFATLRRVAWSGLLLDEAQNIKNADTRQSRAARALKADYRVALTGTPVENHAGELWTLMDFLNPGLLGDRASFRRHIQLPLQTGTDLSAGPRLRRLVRPFILRRMKTDPGICAELPEKISQKIYCPITREQAALYAAELRRLDEDLASAASSTRRGMVLATLTRLKQICNHPAHYLDDGSPLEGRSGKLARLEAMVGEMLETGDRALVFTQFVKMGELLRRHLDDLYGCGAPLLHGGLGRFDRDRIVEDFQSPDGPPVLILSLRAGGTGLNLTAANRVVHFDRWWNPAVENQATDRAHRIGQTRTVTVHAFVCAGTLEERIDELIERKIALAGDLLEEGESWLSELDDRALRGVLELSADVVPGDSL